MPPDHQLTTRQKQKQSKQPPARTEYLTERMESLVVLHAHLYKPSITTQVCFKLKKTKENSHLTSKEKTLTDRKTEAGGRSIKRAIGL